MVSLIMTIIVCYDIIVNKMFYSVDNFKNVLKNIQRPPNRDKDYQSLLGASHNK